MNFASIVCKPWIAGAIGLFMLTGHAQQETPQARRHASAASDEPGNDFQRRTSIEISASSISDQRAEVGSPRSHHAASKAFPGLPRIAALLKARYGIDMPSSGIRRWDTVSVRATAPDSPEDAEDPVLAVSTTEHLTFILDGLEWHVTIQHEQNSEQETCAESLNPNCLAGEVTVRGMADTARSVLKQRFNRQDRK